MANKPTQTELIRQTLERRPYWGPQTVARHLNIDPRVVRVVASRESIKFMDRYEVEKYIDPLVDMMEKMESGDGEA
jgi:hypothetical protein